MLIVDGKVEEYINGKDVFFVDFFEYIEFSDLEGVVFIEKNKLKLRKNKIDINKEVGWLNVGVRMGMSIFLLFFIIIG